MSVDMSAQNEGETMISKDASDPLIPTPAAKVDLSELSLTELQVMRDCIISAGSPEAIFGALEGENAEKLAALNTKYFKLVKKCRVSPELTDAKAVELSKEAFEALAQLYRTAQENIRHGNYGKHLPTSQTFPDGPPIAIIESPQHTYSLHELIAEGDVAMVYRASYLDEKGVQFQACVKIAKDKADNKLLENEQKILGDLHHASLPTIIEGFELGDGRAATVLSFTEGFNLHELREMPTHSSGLKEADYHIGWILERQLAVLGYLHSRGIIHGSVEPAHLIVQPSTHNVTLVDFCWAVKKPGKKDHIKLAQEYYSAPEVYAKEMPLPAIDIYGLGKSAIYLIGGDPESSDLPDSVNPMYQKFLERMTEESTEIRANDAYQLAHHLIVIRDEVSGKRRPFKLLPTDETKGADELSKS